MTPSPLAADVSREDGLSTRKLGRAASPRSRAFVNASQCPRSGTADEIRRYGLTAFVDLNRPTSPSTALPCEPGGPAGAARAGAGKFPPSTPCAARILFSPDDIRDQISADIDPTLSATVHPRFWGWGGTRSPAVMGVVSRGGALAAGDDPSLRRGNRRRSTWKRQVDRPGSRDLLRLPRPTSMGLARHGRLSPMATMTSARRRRGPRPRAASDVRRHRLARTRRPPVSRSTCPAEAHRCRPRPKGPIDLLGSGADRCATNCDRPSTTGSRFDRLEAAHRGTGPAAPRHPRPIAAIRPTRRPSTNTGAKKNRRPSTPVAGVCRRHVVPGCTFPTRPPAGPAILTAEVRRPACRRWLSRQRPALWIHPNGLFVPVEGPALGRGGAMADAMRSSFSLVHPYIRAVPGSAGDVLRAAVVSAELRLFSQTRGGFPRPGKVWWTLQQFWAQGYKRVIGENPRTGRVPFPDRVSNEPGF